MKIRYDMHENLFAVEPDHFAERFRLSVVEDYILVEETDSKRIQYR